MDSVAIGILVVWLVFCLVILGLGLVNYVLTSLALQKLGNRRQIPNAWMAWIPVASSYLIGKIADEYDGRNGFKRKWGPLLLAFDIVTICALVGGYIAMIVWIITLSLQGDTLTEEAAIGMFGGFLVLYAVFLIGAMIAMAQAFCKGVCIYKIFESTVPDRSALYFVLYLLVPMAGSICLFSCRNKGYENEPVPNAVPTYAMPEQTVAPQVIETPEAEIVSEEVTESTEEVVEKTEE